MDIELIKDIITNIKKFESVLDISFKKNIISSSFNKKKFDIVVITATIDEYHSFSKYLIGRKNLELNSDSSLYLEGYLIDSKGISVSVVMPIPVDMGVASASICTTKAILNFQPKYIFMVGICAGIRAIAKLGDVIIAEKTIDYSEVVEVKNSDDTIRTKYMNNLITISDNIKTKARLFSKNQNINCQDLKEGFDISTIKIHQGMLVTGSSLLRNEDKVNQIVKDYQNVKGIDMETYGVYKAACSIQNGTENIHFLSIKSVSDYADNIKSKDKSIDGRELALYSSSLFLYNFIFSGL